MTRPLSLVVLGLSLSSAWGNGHATTFRSLLRAFAARGHSVLFLERDVPWYAQHRDLVTPDWCRLEFYTDLAELKTWHNVVAAADAVMLGSYVPEGVAIGSWVQAVAGGAKLFYDIDTPITLEKLARGDEEYLSAALVPGFDLYLSFTGGPMLQVLEGRYGARAARPLYCSADVVSTIEPEPVRWDLSYLGTYSRDRQPALQRLLLEPALQAPQLRFCVAGAQYPPDIAWPANVERVEHVPPSQHAAFYGASRFTLNVTRAAMVSAGFSPSVRLFEAGAIGTPVISDIWPGIETLLVPGKEILLANGGNDVLRALTVLPEAARLAVGLAAQRRVKAEHSAARRAEQLETWLLQAMADAREKVTG